MTQQIQLSNGRIALVDDEDYELVRGFGWWCWSSGYGTNQYALAKIGGRTIQMHRLIMDAPPGLLVDHINGEGLDNRRSNLRICTNRQNTKNKRRNSNNQTGFKGVSIEKRTNCFRATIWKDGKHIELGLFNCPIHAAIAYDEAAREAHEEFARLNFGDDRDWILIAPAPANRRDRKRRLRGDASLNREGR